MKKFEDMINLEATRQEEEAKAEQQLVNSRWKVLREYTAELFEFLEYVNENYGYTAKDRTEDYVVTFYKDQYGKSRKDGSAFSESTFATTEANRWLDVQISFIGRYTQINIECNEDLRVSAYVYEDKQIDCYSSKELIDALIKIMTNNSDIQKIK